MLEPFQSSLDFRLMIQTLKVRCSGNPPFLTSVKNGGLPAREENQAIGKSVGGNTTKIHMAVDAYGIPIEFDLTGGEVHDSKGRFPPISLSNVFNQT